MKAYDIRCHSEKTFEAVRNGLGRENNVDSAIVSAQLHLVQAVYEVAAQLSELNELLRKQPEIKV